jgi:hypothetical protein
MSFPRKPPGRQRAMTRPRGPAAPRGRKGVDTLLRTSLASVVAWPWFDRVALWSLTRWFLPISRAWAAATVADGSLDRFLAEVPLDRLPSAARPLTELGLRRISKLVRLNEAALAAWDDEFFGDGDVEPVMLAELERARRGAAQSLMMGRTAVANLPIIGQVPRARFSIPGRAEVEARFGAIADRPEEAYRMEGPVPAVERSRAIVWPDRLEYWLRFRSPHAAMGDTAWARVVEPLDAPDAPSLVFGHGLGVELEMLERMGDEDAALIAQGIRVVRLEAPWHNRRRKPGTYGGEPFVATQPLGALDLFAAEVREFAVLIGWCRTQGSRRVAIGGTSLGALASQLAASHAASWPAAMRPDALLLLTTSNDVAGLAFSSSLARGIGIDRALESAGWGTADIDRWRPLLDPAATAPLPPEDIVILLGQVDDVTPFPLGLAMADAWKVPEENLFLRPQGHFSAAVGLVRDPAPLHRLAARLKAR